MYLEIIEHILKGIWEKVFGVFIFMIFQAYSLGFLIVTLSGWCLSVAFHFSRNRVEWHNSGKDDLRSRRVKVVMSDIIVLVGV